MVQFTALSEWKPRNDVNLIYWQGGEGRTFDLPFRFTPEGYANLVTLLHWVIWPIVLVIFSRKLLRRAEK